MLLNQDQIEKIILLVREAGKQARKYYEVSDVDVNYKADNSPVTAADHILSDLIIAGLSKILPHIPIISEESEEDYNLNVLRKNEVYWLIDPIDGTKSFIRKRGDFTINIGLIVNKVPVFGIIYQPLKNALYYTASDKKAYRELNDKLEQIKVREDISSDKALNIVIPTRYLGEEALNFIGSLNAAHKEEVASSYKFCLVADGTYDIYANFSRINTWDIAAGHALLLSAGGKIIEKSGAPLLYDSQSLKAPNFVAFNCNIGEEYIKEKLLALRKSI